MMNFKLLKSGFVVVLGMVVASLVHAATPLKLQDTGNKHNLSVGATWNTIRAVDNTDPRRTQICIFCHTPHNAEGYQDQNWAPLWNHENTAVTTFQMASTANVSPGNRLWMTNTQPTGISKKCLSCHDGTVAIGAVLSGGTIQVQGAKGGSGDTLTGSRSAGGGLGPDGYGQMDAGYIGTDLRGGHVISFNYDQFQQNVDLSEINYRSYNNILGLDSKNKLMFDRNRNMQCHTCHDPHTDWCDDNPAYTVGQDPLWRKQCDGTTTHNDNVCNVCHINPKPGPGFQNYSF